MRNVLLLLCVVAMTACGSTTSNETHPPEYPPVDEEVVTEGETEVVAEVVPEVVEPPGIQVVAGNRTPLETPPTLSLRSPRNGARIRRGHVMLDINIGGWDLAAAPGKHVHLIVDNEPYIALRDLSSPIDVTELMETRGGLAEGTHVVRMFPSRSHHESVKEGAPFVVSTFHVRRATPDFEFDREAPLLTFSRPKGCSTVGAPLLLDFYVSGTELAADGHRVRYAITPNGEGESVTGEIASWIPHQIENLPAGEHTIQLTLIDAEGAAVAGPFNDTTRSITVADSCQ